MQYYSEEGGVLAGVEGWLDSPFAGTPGPIILGGLDPVA